MSPNPDSDRGARKPATSQEATEREEEEVEERSTPPTPVIYAVVRQRGEEELGRPAVSLWWSGVAAGLSISFSLLAQAILKLHLPDAPWAALIVGLGYPVGFLMVVLSRQQLFTENTITVVLPFMAAPSRGNFARLCRNWGIVLAANLSGTLFAALFCTFTPVLPPQILDSMIAIGRELLPHQWSTMFFGGISAGFLMAAMVWLIPGAGHSQFHIVTLVTYLIAVGGFPHIIAGSVETFLLVVNGELPLHDMLIDFALPTLVGNTVGGTALFALLSYAQVMKEL
jgi:formate/nitrite transporter FocA (FNT family)